jgi:membrane-associated phospholipid phosphatase
MTIAATLLFRWYRTKNKGIQSLGRGFLIIALIMGRGRIAIAIHWPTDILVGFIIGIMIAFVTTRSNIQQKLKPIRNRAINIRIKIIKIFHI